MPEISRFYGIVIFMNYRDHNPPHFHARYGEHKVAMGIHDCAIIDGMLPPKALGLVIEWAIVHKEELLENWYAAMAKKQLSPIEPLQ